MTSNIGNNQETTKIPVTEMRFTPRPVATPVRFVDESPTQANIGRIYAPPNGSQYQGTLVVNPGRNVPDSTIQQIYDQNVLAAQAQSNTGAARSRSRPVEFDTMHRYNPEGEPYDHWERNADYLKPKKSSGFSHHFIPPGPEGGNGKWVQTDDYFTNKTTAPEREDPPEAKRLRREMSPQQTAAKPYLAKPVYHSYEKVESPQQEDIRTESVYQGMQPALPSDVLWDQLKEKSSMHQKPIQQQKKNIKRQVRANQKLRTSKEGRISNSSEVKSLQAQPDEYLVPSFGTAPNANIEPFAVTNVREEEKCESVDRIPNPGNTRSLHVPIHDVPVAADRVIAPEKRESSSHARTVEPQKAFPTREQKQGLKGKLVKNQERISNSSKAKQAEPEKKAVASSSEPVPHKSAAAQFDVLAWLDQSSSEG